MERRIAHDTPHTTGLRRVLQERGIKQRWLARQLGVSDGVIGYWCRGEQPIPREDIAAIAKLLKVRQGDIR
jgi:transcriptional regulator with XRE-family HTH domain